MRDAPSQIRAAFNTSRAAGRRELIFIALIVIMGLSASAALIVSRVRLQDYGNTLQNYLSQCVEVERYIRHLMESNEQSWSDDPISDFIKSRLRIKLQETDELRKKSAKQLDNLSNPIMSRLVSLSAGDIKYLRNDDDAQRLLDVARQIVATNNRDLAKYLDSIELELAGAIHYGNTLDERRYRLRRVSELLLGSSKPLLAVLVVIAVAVLIGILAVWFRALKPVIQQLQETNTALTVAGNSLKSQNLALVRQELESKAAQRVARFGYWICSEDDTVICSDGLAYTLGMVPAQLPTSLQQLARIGLQDDALSEQINPAEILSSYLKLRENAGSREFTRIFERSTGDRIIIRERVESLREAQTGTSYLIGIMIDVSELAEAQARVARAEKLDSIGVLTGIITHDVNNVLAIIRGSIDLLKISPNGLEQRLVAMRRAVDSATALIGRLSLISKNESETLELFDVRHELRNSIWMFNSNAHTTVPVELDIKTDGPLFVRMSKAQFNNALLNLMINAREALEEREADTFPAKSIVVVCQLEENPKRDGDEGRAIAGPCVRIDVIDNGCGMSPHALKRSFDPFYSTKQDQSARPRGLGLWSVYQLSRNFGGELVMKSREGAGTTVSMLIPTADAENATSVDTSPAEDYGPRVAGDILIVEDELDLLALLAEQLHHLGYSITKANNLSEAIEALDALPAIRLIISDVNLRHGETGLQLARHVRQTSQDKSMVFISGFVSTAQTEIEFENIPLVRKPIDIDVLDTEIQRAFKTQPGA